MALINKILGKRTANQFLIGVSIITFGIIGLCGIVSFILSVCLGEEIETKFISWVSTLASIIGSCAALMASIVAFLGLSAWKENIYVNRYLEMIWKAQEQIRFLKNVFYKHYSDSILSIVNDSSNQEEVRRKFYQEIDKSRAYLNAVDAVDAVDAFESYEYSGFLELINQIEKHVKDFEAYDIEERSRGAELHSDFLEKQITRIQELLHEQESKAVNYKQ
ncbi:hypothetical protein [Cellvibrio fontiphilus]|uniref:Phage abortive infection protein n=1 Tax=Cellvibrio fontiphilus TaxID=1815559 RepID=A0ABV7FDY1_9GAMM